MLKWEYQVLIVKGYHVQEVNGDYKAAVKEHINPKGFLGGTLRMWPLHEYLSTMGHQGWEVVGVSPTTGPAENRTIDVVVILKRAI
jgi:hypothetical protein